VIGTTPDVIERAEQRLGRRLPPSFAAWLLAHNDSGDVFPVLDDRAPRTLTGDLFHERDQLAHWVQGYGKPRASVDHLLPVVEVGDGDLWCLDLDRRDADGEAPVVRWLHETNECEEVAASFEVFIVMYAAGELAE
jgi:cell wall assembly regulator SMI1